MHNVNEALTPTEFQFGSESDSQDDESSEDCIHFSFDFF